MAKQGEGSMGYVYFIRSGDRDRFKVGYTVNSVEQRQKELQTGNPDKLSIFYVIESEYAETLEASLHIRLSEYQTEAKNEWFAISEPKLKEIIDEGIKRGRYQTQGEASRVIGTDVRQIWGRQQNATPGGRKAVLSSGDQAGMSAKHKRSFFSLGT